ncbi:MAG: sigma-70 family RNA polymerase sigma factor, partial [Lachnospiraceae bacterium]|nr:sigma-70 family RNA polymerase sigma factor [Lachnospiraceae bacterium]
QRLQKDLLAEHSTINEKGEKTSVHVYADGYVLYEVGNHFTVFNLEEVKGKKIEYEAVDTSFTNRTSRSLTNEEYMELCWYVALFLVASDKIELNLEKDQAKIVQLHITEDNENQSWMGKTEDLIRGRRKEDMVDLILKHVSMKQWSIFQLVFLEEMSQAEVAKMFCITQQAVSKICAKTLRKLAEHAAEFSDYCDVLFDQSRECKKRYFKGSNNADKKDNE